MFMKTGKPKDIKHVFISQLATSATMVKGFILVQVIRMVDGMAHFHHFKPRLMLLTKQVVMSVRASSVFPSRAIRQEVCDDACTELE